MKIETEFPAASGVTFGPLVAQSFVGHPVDYLGNEVGTITKATVKEDGSAICATVDVTDEDLARRFKSGQVDLVGDKLQPGFSTDD